MPFEFEQVLDGLYRFGKDRSNDGVDVSMPKSIYPRNGLAPPQPKLLVLESNSKVLQFLGRTLGGAYGVSLFAEAEALFDELEGQRGPGPDLIVLAWDSCAKSLATFTRLRTLQPKVPVVVLSCSSEMSDYGIFARLGASAVVLKPFMDDNLRAAIAAALPGKEDAESPATKEVKLDENHSFVRASKRMCEIETQATLVARSDVPVLILGESGTGKEILALFTHNMSRRSKKMFLKINCAAMPAELLESELFGYEQGAFTGAIKTKPGKFETCDGGTIFLDEIGEMPAILQAKLLQVLQDGTFSRLGGRTTMRTDVRVIAATNINMKEAMQQKTFREDLYYRLNGMSLMLPPLRERMEEIVPLAEYFIRKALRKYDLQPLALSKEMVSALSRHRWPGNLRELENVINRYLILRDESAIIAELLNDTRALAADGKVAPGAEGRDLKSLVRGLKGEAESSTISTVLEEKGWNRKAAANDLQISYKALLYKIKQYDLTPKST